MLLIIAHHYVVNSGLPTVMQPEPLSAPSLFLSLFGAWGKTGINCFVLITGYFMCKSSITLSKFLKLLLVILFYKFVLYFTFACGGYVEPSVTQFARYMMPVASLRDNFVGCYIVFFLFIPFLNILVLHMSSRQHAWLIALCLGAYTVFAALRPVSMNYVTWFCILYFVASYIRLHGFLPRLRTWHWGLVTFALFLLACASIVLMLYTGRYSYRLVSDCNAPFALLLGISSKLAPFLRHSELQFQPLVVLSA